MAIVVTTIGTNANSSGATVAISSLTISAGALIFVGTNEAGSTSSGTVADSASNTYTSVTSKGLNNDTASGVLSAYYAKNVSALSSGSITYTKGTSGRRATINGFYATGIDKTAPLDSAVNNTASGNGTTSTITSGTPSTTGDLMVGLYGSKGSTSLAVDSGNGWSATPDYAATGTAGAEVMSIGGHQVNSGTGTKTFSTSQTSARDWASITTAFKVAVTPIGLSTETDTAFAITARRTHAIGLATETDTAFDFTPGVGGGTTIEIGLATETDTAFAATPLRTHAIGLATETDTAFAATPLRTHTIGLATETDTAFAFGSAKNQAIGLATETDTAFAAQPQRAYDIGLATETDTAFEVTAIATGRIQLAVETDTAFAFNRLKERAIGLATETDTATAFAYTIIPPRRSAIAIHY